MSGVAGSMSLTFLVAVIGKYKVTDLGDFSESIDKFLKPASGPSVLQSIRVCSWECLHPGDDLRGK